MDGSDEQVVVVAGDLTATLTVTGPSCREIAITGDLDAAAVDELRAAFEVTSSDQVVIDLSGVTFMASSGINWLVGLHRRAGQLLVRSPSPIVRRVLEVTGLTDVLALGPEDPEGRGPPSG